MARHQSLADAVAEHVHDGDTVALEGFTHLIPFAAGHEIIRQGRRDLTLVRMTPDVVYDQLIGAGCARRLVFSWGGNPGVGSLHRFREAVQAGWPVPLEIEEHSHAGMAARYVAGASGLPFAVLRGYLGTDLMTVTDTIRTIECPFTGETLAAVPALNPDVTIIHAQQADRAGNVALWGITGVQKEAVLAADRSIVTVEEVVDELSTPYGAVVLPGWAVTAVAEVPGGAAPSYAAGYSVRDNDAYQEWDAISRDRDHLRAVAARDRARHGGDRMSTEPTWTADEMMTVAASRALHGVRSCFVGIGLPSTAANLARTTHAPDLVLVYESGCLGSQARLAAAVDRRRRAGRDGDLGGLRPRDLQLLAAARPDRGRLPRRGPDRPARQHQHHGDRAVRRPRRCDCPARAAPPRSPPRAVR